MISFQPPSLDFLGETVSADGLTLSWLVWRTWFCFCRCAGGLEFEVVLRHQSCCNTVSGGGQVCEVRQRRLT